MQSTEPETWKPIPGYEGYYEVSDHGGVRSVDRAVARTDGKVAHLPGRPMSTHIHNGYPTVRLSRDNERPAYRVHRLVLEAFAGPAPAGTEACHNDGDRGNCTLNNLRWDTRSENNRDRIRHGTDPSTNKTHCPLGHPLTAPNLVPHVLKRRGFRMCRACDLAHHHAHFHGEPFDPSVAHAKYDGIMAGKTRVYLRRSPKQGLPKSTTLLR